MRLRLATKFSWAILGIVAISILSNLIALYGAFRISKRLEETARESLPSVRVEEVQILFYQRNSLLAAYLLDAGNLAWETKLGDLGPRFIDWIATVRKTNVIPDEELLLIQLEQRWAEFDALQDRVIALHKQGDDAAARTLFTSAIGGRVAQQINDLCQQLIKLNNEHVQAIMERAAARIRMIWWVVGVAGSLSLVLGGFLLWLFFYGVLFPLRGMVADAQLFHGSHRVGGVDSEQDELRLMGSHFRDLMLDVSDTRSRLERSHDRLLASEKLASVGKLAASVAHEIRNPLTAIKMWLFSIQESALGDSELGRKVGIVSEEITQLENVVRSFLEFSRPPTLQRRPQDVAVVLDQTLELLRPRFVEANISAESSPRGDLPLVMADGAQLKQVLINLLGNAADAMSGGGAIRINSTAESDADGRPMVVVRVCDTGSGIPQDVQRRIFEPFFTTKETGTGLGLCIAAQVMARHGGALVLESSTDRGTVFAVWIPTAGEENHGQNPDR